MNWTGAIINNLLTSFNVLTSLNFLLIFHKIRSRIILYSNTITHPVPLGSPSGLSTSRLFPFVYIPSPYSVPSRRISTLPKERNGFFLYLGTFVTVNPWSYTLTGNLTNDIIGNPSPGLTRYEGLESNFFGCSSDFGVKSDLHYPLTRLWHDWS